MWVSINEGQACLECGGPMLIVLCYLHSLLSYIYKGQKACFHPLCHKCIKNDLFCNSSECCLPTMSLLYVLLLAIITNGTPLIVSTLSFLGVIVFVCSITNKPLHLKKNERPTAGASRWAAVTKNIL